MPLRQTGFIGFPDGKMKPVNVPDIFFTDLLPQIDDLAELKLTLHAFWLLNVQESEVRYLRGDDLRSDEMLLRGLEPGDRIAHGTQRRWKTRCSAPWPATRCIRLEVEEPPTPRVRKVVGGLVLPQHGQGTADRRDDPHGQAA